MWVISMDHKKIEEKNQSTLDFRRSVMDELESGWKKGIICSIEQPFVMF